MRFPPFSIIITIVALSVVGIALAPGLGIRLHPSAHLPTVNVNFSWPGVPALTVEREVTSRIESALATMKGIEKMTSLSRQGQGSITLNLKEGVDVEMARFEMASHIRRVFPQLPDNVSYPSVSTQGVAGQTRVLMSYRIIAPEQTALIEDYTTKTIIPALSRIGGFQHAMLHGVTPLEYRLEFDSRNLRTMGVTVDEIQSAIAGYFSTNDLGMVTVVHEDKANEIMPLVIRANRNLDESWENIPVKATGNTIVYLNQLATARLVQAEPNSYYRINGKTTVVLNIFAQEGANQLVVAGDVRAVMDDLKGKMPTGWSATVTSDNTHHIRKDLSRVTYRMVFSFVILMLFVAIVTRKSRYLLMILATVLANLAIAIILYRWLGIEIHLYSLAGITVSFGMMIDNSIVMIEHMRTRGNQKAFLAILAATATTIGSLSVIFLLGRDQQLQFRDFAMVVMVNLFVSLGIALFFIPSLFKVLRLELKESQKSYKLARIRVRIWRTYLWFVIASRRWRWVSLVVFLLVFGIPLHMLPTRVEGTSLASDAYNQTIGSRFYQETLRKPLEVALGGTFRLFSQYVFERSYFSDPERTTLNVTASMPDGATLEQINQAVMQMEDELSLYDEIDQFRTSISSRTQARITISFKPEYEKGIFPHILKNTLIQKAISIGGAEWGVWGVGQGFSNRLGSGGGGRAITLTGYNYDLLYRYAGILTERARQNRRVSQTTITGGDSWYSAPLMEFYMDANPRRLAAANLTLAQVHSQLEQLVMSRPSNTVYVHNQPVAIRLVPDQYMEYHLWDLEHRPLYINNQFFKPGELLSLSRRATGNNIYKEDQQYHIRFNFTFLGPPALEARVTRELSEYIIQEMPIGFSASSPGFDWSVEKQNYFRLILLVVVIIFFVCSILLNSLSQPLAVLSLVPFSFSGLFLTFYLFNLNFDQGGWASFILLSGLAVNAGLYILNDYNNMIRETANPDQTRTYLKAFRHKITPVLLTILSTIIGLIPFVVGTREPFWFAFAAGTIGGLTFNILGIFLLFPAFASLRIGSGRDTRVAK